MIDPNKAPTKRPENGFCTPLRVESVDPRTWELLTNLRWVGSDGDVVEVPAGSHTDFASVPQIFQSIVPRTGAWTKAAVIHDHLCETLRLDYEFHEQRPGAPCEDPPVFCPVDTDGVFEKIMVEDGVKRWKAAMIWAAVRWGALASSYRREDWFRTFFRLMRITLVVLVVVLAVLTGLYLLTDLIVKALA